MAPNEGESQEARVATRGNSLDFGSFGLVAQESKEVWANQIEAARKTMARFTNNAGKIWIRIFTDMPITKKPAEVGMGKGRAIPSALFTESGRAM